MQPDYDAYVFDLYGTLVDIRTDEEDPALWVRFARALAAYGLRMRPEALRSAWLRLCAAETEAQERRNARHGLEGPCEIDLLRVWRRLFLEHGLRLSRREARAVSWEFRRRSLRRLRLYPGARALLAALRRDGKRLVLLSNAQASFTLPELRLLGLPGCFDAILLSSDAHVKKPSPAFFRRLAAVGAAPGRALMIGNDPEADCRGAQAYGMDSLFLRTAQSPAGSFRLPERCREIASLDEVYTRTKSKISGLKQNSGRGKRRPPQRTPNP